MHNFFYIQSSLCIRKGCFGCIHTWCDSGCNEVGRPQWISTTVEPQNLIHVFRGGAALKSGRDNYQQKHQHARLDSLTVFWVTGYSLSTFWIHCSKTFLSFRVAGHTKYQLWLWRMLACEQAILTPKQAFEYKWNTTAYLNGIIKGNIPNLT